MRILLSAATMTCLLFTHLTAGRATRTLSAWNDYSARLAKVCPDKHLEMLAPGELIDIVDEFTRSLPADKQKVVRASIKRSCRGVDMGATCDNIGFVQDAIQLQELDRFVQTVCALPEKCTDYSVCIETK